MTIYLMRKLLYAFCGLPGADIQACPMPKHRFEPFGPTAPYLAFLRVEIAAFHPVRQVYLGTDSSLWLYLFLYTGTSWAKLDVSLPERLIRSI